MNSFKDFSSICRKGIIMTIILLFLTSLMVFPGIRTTDLVFAKSVF